MPSKLIYLTFFLIMAASHAGPPSSIAPANAALRAAVGSKTNVNLKKLIKALKDHPGTPAQTQALREAFLKGAPGGTAEAAPAVLKAEVLDYDAFLDAYWVVFHEEKDAEVRTAAHSEFARFLRVQAQGPSVVHEAAIFLDVCRLLNTAKIDEDKAETPETTAVRAEHERLSLIREDIDQALARIDMQGKGPDNEAKRLRVDLEEGTALLKKISKAHAAH